MPFDAFADHSDYIVMPCYDIACRAVYMLLKARHVAATVTDVALRACCLLLMPLR